ncbi:hypothetical protein IGI37_000206 [Enterococcus sp. AZ194]|uniref:hypothetical protein n=1 Tax=Enterococcus sp. AZ194 TaxID=2774629 RepID=UPI003F1F2E36
MFRLIKADFYRLLHTKGFIATGVAVIAFAILIITSGSPGGIMVDLSLKMPVMMDLKSAINSTIFSSSVLIYLLIGVFVIVIGYEFSQKTYKNSLTSGVSRFQFILAKYISEVLYLSFFMILYFGAAIVTAYVKFGSTQSDFMAFLGETFLLAIAFGLVISVVFSLATLLLVGMGSLVGATVFIVVYPIIIQIISQLTQFDGLEYFDFFNFIQILGVGQLGFDDLLPYILTSAVVTILSLMGSTLLIRTKEL